MANVSISKAAELAGISRTSLYRTYIKQGKITVSKDSAGKKCIDTAELLRVFGELKTNSKTVSILVTSVAADSTETVSMPVASVSVDSTQLQAENAFLKQQVEELQQDKAWYQSQIAELASSIKLLEAPKQTELVYPRLWWQFWK